MATGIASSVDHVFRIASRSAVGMYLVCPRTATRKFHSILVHYQRSWGGTQRVPMSCPESYSRDSRRSSSSDDMSIGVITVMQSL